MSSDNYNWIDFHAEREGAKWSVTNGFASDDEPPEVPNGSTVWFDTFELAHNFSITDWTEYGERFSNRAWREVLTGRAAAVDSKIPKNFAGG